MSSFTPVQNMQCVTKSECDIVPSYPSWKKIQNDQGFWSNTVTNKTGLEQLPKRFYKKPCKHMQKSHGIGRVLAPRAIQTIWKYGCWYSAALGQSKNEASFVILNIFLTWWVLHFIKNWVIHYSLWLLRKRQKQFHHCIEKLFKIIILILFHS